MRKQKILKRLVLADIVIVGSYQLFSPFYALFAEQLGASIKQTGLIWAVSSLTTAFALLFFGKLENNFNKKKIVVYGFFAYSLGAFAFLLVNNLAMLIAVLMFNSLVSGFTLPAYKTIFTKLQDHGKETEEWSWLDAGNMIAMSIGAAIGGFVLSTFGFNGIFILIGTLQALAALFVERVLNTHVNLETDLKRAVSAAKNIK